MPTEGERELRGWLANRLEMDDVPPPLWRWLGDDGFIDGVLDPRCPVSEDDLLCAARDRLRLARELSPFVDGSGPDGSPDSSGSVTESHIRVFLAYQMLEQQWDMRSEAPDDPVTHRAVAFSMYLAKLADEVPEVKRLRQHLWEEGEPLTSDEVKELLRSRAAAVLSVDDFRSYGISVRAHESEMVSQTFTRDRFWLRADGIVAVGNRGVDSRESTPDTRVRFGGTVLASNPASPGAAELRSAAHGVHGPSHLGPRVLRGSVISDLLDVADGLERRFPWGSTGDDPMHTLEYILTGAPPLIEPIRIDAPAERHEVGGPMNISVWPWVPVTTLASRYGDLRKTLDPTPTSAQRRLALLNFVLRRPDVRILEEGGSPKTPPWRELRDSWNEHYREGHEWHYTDVRNFSRDFRHAYNQTVRYYHSPEKPDEPDTRRREQDS